MVAPGSLQNPEVQRWLDDAEPAWTLLEFESFNALRREPSMDNRAIHLASDLSSAEIAEPAVARNALILLGRAVDSEGPTATGNLSRAVVAEMYHGPGCRLIRRIGLIRAPCSECKVIHAWRKPDAWLEPDRAETQR